MPPGIIKDPSQSPGVIYRGDASSVVTNLATTPVLLPATIISKEGATDNLSPGEHVIFDIEHLTVQVGTHSYVIDVATNIISANNLTNNERRNRWREESLRVLPELGPYFTNTSFYNDILFPKSG
jgi:hypothetical protein